VGFEDVLAYKKSRPKAAFFINSQYYWPCFASSIIFSFAVMANSTRRFWLFPSAVSLVAIGSASPIPVVVKRDEEIPFEIRYVFTELARSRERPRLYSSAPSLSV